MISLKIKYTTEEENKSIIFQYRKEFSNAVRYSYNRICEGKSRLDVERSFVSLNNLGLINCYLKKCAVGEAHRIFRDLGCGVIFGGKENYLKRCSGKITKDEYLKRRLMPMVIVGESSELANRFVRINKDCESFTFQPIRTTKIILKIDGNYTKYKSILNKLYKKQQSKSIPLTYTINDEYITITFDEKAIRKNKNTKTIKNRVFAIDLNPNYVGWSVVDWKSSSEYNIIKSGVISTKIINDYQNTLHEASTSNKLKHITNKRIFETFQISKLLVNTALHYKCEMFVIEDLNIKNRNIGKNNRLVNNQWNRLRLSRNLGKRCNISGLKYLEVKPNYSSFIGNFLFRDGVNPDMVLASIELGRRGYEYCTQYITKEKEIKKNIIQPRIDDFRDRYIKSLEEFGIEGDFKDLVGIYYFLKNSKTKYRVSFEEVNLDKSFSRCFSHSSLVMKCLINN